MNTYIYLVRHGEVHNPDMIYYGRLPNFGLSENGKREIEQTGDFLKSKNLTAIYASPMLRAKQTAAIIQKKVGLDTFHLSKNLIEILTSYQGTPFAQLDPMQSEVYLKPKHPTDETVTSMAARMLTAVISVQKKHQGKHVALVSHGDPAMSLQALIKKQPLIFQSIRDTAYIQHGEVRLITINEKKHMTIQNIFKPLRIA